MFILPNAIVANDDETDVMMLDYEDGDGDDWSRMVFDLTLQLSAAMNLMYLDHTNVTMLTKNLPEFQSINSWLVDLN